MGVAAARPGRAAAVLLGLLLALALPPRAGCGADPTAANQELLEATVGLHGCTVGTTSGPTTTDVRMGCEFTCGRREQRRTDEKKSCGARRGAEDVGPERAGDPGPGPGRVGLGRLPGGDGADGHEPWHGHVREVPGDGVLLRRGGRDRPVLRHRVGRTKRGLPEVLGRERQGPGERMLPQRRAGADTETDDKKSSATRTPRTGASAPRRWATTCRAWILVLAGLPRDGSP